MTEPSFQETQIHPPSKSGDQEWYWFARFVALYFSLQFLTGLASILIGGSGILGKEPGLDLESDLVQYTETQSRILPGILAQLVSFLPGLGLIGLLVGRDAFVMGKLGNPFRLCLEFLVVSMGCHIVHQMILWIHQSVWDFTPHPHPFTKLGLSIQAPWIWFVLTMVACVTAPINEEIIFRRMAHLWLGGSFGEKSLFFLAAIFAILGCSQNKSTNWVEQTLPVFWVFGLFVLTLIMGGKPETKWTVASACLFSAIHSFAWPTPVPLFFFGIYQVFLMNRTGGILAPILFHAWFNFLGVVGLMSEVFGS